MKAFVKDSKSPVLEILESYGGDLYFRVEAVEDDGTTFGFVRLYAMPDCAEWGCFNMNELKKSYGENHIWPVKKENWSNINTYEKGLLEVIV